MNGPCRLRMYGRASGVSQRRSPADRTVEWLDRHLWHLEGDDQADRSVHGGPDKDVYAYGLDDYRWWAGELGSELGPGSFGENLTIDGFDVSDALIGERWRFGD